MSAGDRRICGGGVLAVASLASASVAAVAVVVPAGASTTTTRAAASPKLTQLGHVTFWECKSKTTEILVAVN
jgi:hypothetical protein